MSIPTTQTVTLDTNTIQTLVKAYKVYQRSSHYNYQTDLASFMNFLEEQLVLL